MPNFPPRKYLKQLWLRVKLSKVKNCGITVDFKAFIMNFLSVCLFLAMHAVEELLMDFSFCYFRQLCALDVE